MENLSKLQVAKQPSRAQANGIGAVLCYDPYFERMMLSIRKSLAAGHPVMIRFHPGAQYPAPEEMIYANDLEAHAVLIVGYDDQKQALAIMDPWDNKWGGNKGGLRWVAYKEVATLIVNGTKDCFMVAAPLEVTAEVIRDEEHGPRLHVRAGFHAPDAIVMDQANLMVREVTVRPSLSAGWQVLGAAELRAEGEWKVGEYAELTFQLNEEVAGDARIQLEVEARVSCERPYPFVDTIATQVETMVHAEALRIASVG